MSPTRRRQSTRSRSDCIRYCPAWTPLCARSPVLPMHDALQWNPLGRFELTASAETESEQRSLRIALVWDSQQVRHLLLVREVKRGPRAHEAPVARGKHEAPGSGKNGTVQPRDPLVVGSGSVRTSLDARDDHHRHL